MKKVNNYFIIALFVIAGITSAIVNIINAKYMVALTSFVLAIGCAFSVLLFAKKSTMPKPDENEQKILDLNSIKLGKIFWIVMGSLLLITSAQFFSLYNNTTLYVGFPIIILVKFLLDILVAFKVSAVF